MIIYPVTEIEVVRNEANVDRACDSALEIMAGQKNIYKFQFWIEHKEVQ